MEEETLNSLRYCFQRILVPCVVLIGIIGNFISVIVLTRRRMRCSTNVYLTALAVTDIIYLLFVFILSLQHYPNMHHSRYELYWRSYGLSHWFCDASTYTSIYLTVSFTIERYIAVCHPIRGQVLCTESRAKRVISVVVFLCLLLSVTTAFEHQLTTETKYVDAYTKKLCSNVTIINNTNDCNLTCSGPIAEMSIDNEKRDNDFINNINNNKAKTIHYNNKSLSPHDITDDVLSKSGTMIEAPGSTSTISTNHTAYCRDEYYLYPTSSAFGSNETYRMIFFPLTSIIFVFLPLVLLATFNCFLIAAVHRSHKMRHKMTNARRNEQTSSSQENKITITLIAVVVLFLVCQSPTAIFLIYNSWPHEFTDKEMNLSKALGNFLNFLVTMNAACNFLLYCALSDKYRQTVKSLFIGRIQRQNTYNSSSRYSRCASRGPLERSSFYANPNTTGEQPKISRNSLKPENKSVIINDKNQNRKRIPSVSISVTPRPSMTSSEFAKFDVSASRKNSTISVQPQSSFRSTGGTSCASTCSATVHRNCNADNCNRLLKPSPSQTSLTRSQSLILRPAMRHSPDCRESKFKL